MLEDSLKEVIVQYFGKTFIYYNNIKCQKHELLFHQFLHQGCFYIPGM